MYVLISSQVVYNNILMTMSKHYEYVVEARKHFYCKKVIRTSKYCSINPVFMYQKTGSYISLKNTIMEIHQYKYRRLWFGFSLAV